MAIIRANSAFCNMLGYMEDEVKSVTLRSFTHSDYVAEDDVGLLRLVAEEIPVYHTENRFNRKDGSIIWGSTTISIIRNNYDEVQYFLVMIEVSLRENRLKRSLLLPRRRPRKVTVLRRPFSIMFHNEIRTPMNAIIGFSALLNEPYTTAEERKQFYRYYFSEWKPAAVNHK